MKRLILLLGIVFVGPFLSARQIPHYKMDSFAFFSDAVILCEETNLRFVETEYPGNTKTTHAVVSIKIIEVFKGDLKQGTEMKIEFDPVFGRYRAGQRGYKDMSRNPPVIVPHKYLPIGKTVLFLKRLKNADGFRVVTAKLIQEKEILKYLQFSNPGPLVLTEQFPENVTLTDDEKYDEKAFLRDVRLAIKASLSLKEPEKFDPWKTGRVRIYKNRVGAPPI